MQITCAVSCIHSIICEEEFIPAEQQPKIRPSMRLGGLVILIKIHPKAEPNINVPRIFTGMNHLKMRRKKMSQKAE